MTLSLFTYNTLFNNDANKIGDIINKYHSDIVCLQEALTDDINTKKFEKMGYKLADYSNSFIRLGKNYGVATFYNPNSLRLVHSSSISLSQSFYELFLILIYGTKKPRTVLKTHFLTRAGNKKLTVYNVHFTPFGANGARLRQLRETLQDTKKISYSPTIVAGDFNYPYGRRKLEEFTKRYNLKEATKNIGYTYSVNKRENVFDLKQFNLFQKVIINLTNCRFVKRFLSGRYKFDYVFFRGLQLVSTQRVQTTSSDHFPIISTFEI